MIQDNKPSNSRGSRHPQEQDDYRDLDRSSQGSRQNSHQTNQQSDASRQDSTQPGAPRSKSSSQQQEQAPPGNAQRSNR